MSNMPSSPQWAELGMLEFSELLWTHWQRIFAFVCLKRKRLHRRIPPHHAGILNALPGYPINSDYEYEVGEEKKKDTLTNTRSAHL